MPTLAIRCELLLGVYQASDPFRGPDAPEWPPHPFRLHAALVAAACEQGGAEPAPAAVDALRWLEALGAPTVLRTKSSTRTRARVFVPRNPLPVEFTRSKNELKKNGRFVSPWLRNGRYFPTSVPEIPVVTYRWEGAGPAPNILKDLVEGVSWLGSSRSPVACSVHDQFPGQLAPLEPRDGGAEMLRVAAPGTTDTLLSSRHQWPTPEAGRAISYGVAPAGSATETTTGPFSDVVVRAIIDPILGMTDAAPVATALRAAVLSRAGDTAPAALHGHTDDDRRVAFLALGDVGHHNATGLIRGVAIALPHGITGDERGACVRAFSLVNPLSLGRGIRPLRLTDELPPIAALRPERWIGPSQWFSTVTPIILDRYPKKNSPIETEIRRSLDHAGYPSPAAVHLPVGPPVTATPHPSRLGGNTPPGLRVHASIYFKQPLRGPLLVGRGRFRGIGLLLPVSRP